jgi:hypothetical protein
MRVYRRRRFTCQEIVELVTDYLELLTLFRRWCLDSP